MEYLSRPQPLPTTHLYAMLLLAIPLLLPANASAQTQIRLQTLSDTTIVTEGYKQTLEERASQTLTYRDRNASALGHYPDAPTSVWVSDVRTLLFDDRDGDGYYSGFSLTIDVDNDRGNVDVYAKIYLQLQSQPIALLHTTETFSIYGKSTADEYRVEAELLHNYAAGHYDVNIDIHEARSDRLLDNVSPHSFHNLDGLPLESEPARPSQTDNVQITEYVGFWGPGMVLTLSTLLLWRRHRRR